MPMPTASGFQEWGSIVIGHELPSALSHPKSWSAVVSDSSPPAARSKGILDSCGRQRPGIDTCISLRSPGRSTYATRVPGVTSTDSAQNPFHRLPHALCFHTQRSLSAPSVFSAPLPTPAPTPTSACGASHSNLRWASASPFCVCQHGNCRRVRTLASTGLFCTTVTPTAHAHPHPRPHPYPHLRCTLHPGTANINRIPLDA